MTVLPAALLSCSLFFILAAVWPLVDTDRDAWVVGTCALLASVCLFGALVAL